MPKLTDEQREQSKRALRERLITAIEESPRGLTLEDVQQCFQFACKYALLK